MTDTWGRPYLQSIWNTMHHIYKNRCHTSNMCNVCRDNYDRIIQEVFRDVVRLSIEEKGCEDWYLEAYAETQYYQHMDATIYSDCDVR